jgi:hypothetical protein
MRTFLADNVTRPKRSQVGEEIYARYPNTVGGKFKTYISGAEADGVVARTQMTHFSCLFVERNEQPTCSIGISVYLSIYDYTSSLLILGGDLSGRQAGDPRSSKTFRLEFTHEWTTGPRGVFPLS